MSRVILLDAGPLGLVTNRLSSFEVNLFGMAITSTHSNISTVVEGIPEDVHEA
ncbi:MAG: hypothetical protein AAGD25_05135 [Cyanobacteria bacterium P01_F01_bin.150]